YQEFRLSPNGQKAAYSRADLLQETTATSAGKLWMLDLASGAQPSLGAEMSFRVVAAPLWSPDSEEIFFAGAQFSPERQRSEVARIYRMPVRGAGKPELVLQSDMTDLKPLDITRNGKVLLVSARRNESQTGLDLWYVVLPSELKPRKFLETAFAEKEG